MTKGVLKYSKLGAVLVLGDFNARIGVSASETEDGRKWERTNEDEKVNKEGKILVPWFNSLNLVVLNGTGGEAAKLTHRHKSGNGGSMIDLVAVPSHDLDDWGKVKVTEKGNESSDHSLVLVERKGSGGSVSSEGKGNGVSIGSSCSGSSSSASSSGGRRKVKKMDVRRHKKDKWRIFRKNAKLLDRWVDDMVQASESDHNLDEDHMLEAWMKAESGHGGREARGRGERYETRDQEGV